MPEPPPRSPPGTGTVGPSVMAKDGIVRGVSQRESIPLQTGGADALRRIARDAFARGDMTAATQAQAAVLDLARAGGPIPVADYLFGGLVLHASSRNAEALALLREAVRAHPADPVVHENLAVLQLTTGDLAGAVTACEAARALGNQSPNLFDCLCEAYWRLGRPADAIAAGRAALVAKDQQYATTPPIVTVPDGRPPPFDPNARSGNVIAYSLWGNAPRYQVPLLENARLLPHLFPAWTIRVYHDDSVAADYLRALASLGVQRRRVIRAPDVPEHRGTLWRFEVIADPAVRRFLIRDADSLLTVKERVAVDAWLASDFYFHAMRDWYSHTDPLLAGLWGGVGGILPPPATLLRAHRPWRAETPHLDQDILASTVWPAIRHHVLVHDSMFAPTLGGVPFPPFGALPPGHHVGENAYAFLNPSPQDARPDER